MEQVVGKMEFAFLPLLCLGFWSKSAGRKVGLATAAFGLAGLLAPKFPESESLAGLLPSPKTAVLPWTTTSPESFSGAVSSIDTLSGGGGSAVRGSHTLSNFHKVDLDPKTALQDWTFLRDRVVEEHGWTEVKAEAAIFEYLRFLRLLGEAPSMELVASEAVDLVWHEHLLDTTNYAEDCFRLFGRFMHHRRARNEAERADIPNGYERSKRVYRARYGQEPPDELWGPTTTSASMCGGSGKKGKDGKGGSGGRDPYDFGPEQNGNSTSGSDSSSSDSSGSDKYFEPTPSKGENGENGEDEKAASTSATAARCSSLFFLLGGVGLVIRWS